MNDSFYIKQFEAATRKIDKQRFSEANLQVAVTQVLASVAVKAYKLAWVSDAENLLAAESRLFFSIWVNDATIQEKRLYYNIHAFKLRQLKPFAISSKLFADYFRKLFAQQAQYWPNVQVNFGPLTLMQGWVPLDEHTLQDDVISLLNNFLTISPFIDETLKAFLKQN